MPKDEMSKRRRRIAADRVGKIGAAAIKPIGREMKKSSSDDSAGAYPEKEYRMRRIFNKALRGKRR